MKKMMSLCSGLVTIALLSGAAHAVSIPYNIGNVEDFLNNGTYFGATTWVHVVAQNFAGAWEYTAIASEAGNQNITESPTSTVGFSDSANVFTNANSGDWGTFEQIDFNSGNIYFEDSNNPFDVPLDPFSAENSGYFRVYQLTAASQLLSYLATDIVLPTGTIIVGYNDNASPPTQDNRDSDYDDLVIALKPVNAVPEPSALLLLGSGLLGLVGLNRRRKA